MTRKQYIQCVKLGIDVNAFLMYGNLLLQPGKCIEPPSTYLPVSQVSGVCMYVCMRDNRAAALPACS